ETFAVARRQFSRLLVQNFVVKPERGDQRMLQIICVDALRLAHRGDRGHGVTDRIVQSFQPPAAGGLAVDLSLPFEFFMPANSAFYDRHRNERPDDSFYPR